MGPPAMISRQWNHLNLRPGSWTRKPTYNLTAVQYSFWLLVLMHHQQVSLHNRCRDQDLDVTVAVGVENTRAQNWSRKENLWKLKESVIKNWFNPLHCSSQNRSSESLCRSWYWGSREKMASRSRKLMNCRSQSSPICQWKWHWQRSQLWFLSKRGSADQWISRSVDQLLYWKKYM